MAEVKSIIKKIENFAPLDTVEAWDNSGWQINLGIKETKKILTALDVTEQTVDEAIKHHCDLIISHHPVFFSPIKSISEPFIIKAIKNNIQIYSAHTNLDTAKGGVNDILAEKCGFKNTAEFCRFVRFTKLKKSKDFSELIEHLKKTFNIKTLKITNSKRKTYNSIAFCCGSGAEFIPELEKHGIDVFITGDVKHHNALEAGSITVIDLGHYNSEKHCVDIFENIIQNEKVQIIKAEEKEAWEFI